MPRMPYENELKCSLNSSSDFVHTQKTQTSNLLDEAKVANMVFTTRSKRQALKILIVNQRIKHIFTKCHLDIH